MLSNTNDPMRVVTEQDVLGAVVSLGSLPRRASDTAELDLMAFRIALEGVKAADLSAAVRAVLQGALGHAFFPAPPELRLQCNAAMDVRASEAARDLKRKRDVEERAALRRIEHSPEQRARVAAMHRAFHDSLRPMSEADEVNVIRQRYDPTLLATIPDRAPTRATG